MIVSTNDSTKEYVVFWRYDKEVGKTTCTIKYKDGEDILTSGIAWCSPFDQFEKQRGRKVSLTRALGYGMFPNKTTRASFWKQYDKDIGLCKTKRNENKRLNNLFKEWESQEANAALQPELI